MVRKVPDSDLAGSSIVPQEVNKLLCIVLQCKGAQQLTLIILLVCLDFLSLAI